MFHRAPSLGRLTLVFLCLAVLGGLLFFQRCRPVVPLAAVRSPTSTANQLAHLTMVNSSQCEWEIVATAVADGARHRWNLPVAKTIEAELASGDYAVEQTMLAEGAAPDATRRFTLRLEPKQSYRWRLMTLLSDEAADGLTAENSKAAHE